jgi:hypothetical protein
MRRTFFAVSIASALCCVVFSAWGQELGSNGPFTGLPSLATRGNFPGDSGGSASEIVPGIGRAAFNLGYAKLHANASFTQEGNPTLISLTHRYRLSGIWYELLQQIFVTNKVGIVMNGSYLEPASETMGEDALFPGGFSITRLWATSTRLWGIGGGMTYNFTKGMTAIGGVNYNAFDLKFLTTLEDSGGQVFVRPQSQVAVRIWSPYLGLVLNQNSSNATMSLGVIACPVILGTLDYALAGSLPGLPSGANGGLRDSRFLTLNADYSLKMLGGAANIGAFVRWTIIPAEFALTLQPGPGPPPPGDTNIRIRANAQLITVGATGTFYFKLPI